MTDQAITPPLRLWQRPDLWGALAVVLCALAMAGQIARVGDGLSALVGLGENLGLHRDPRIPAGWVVQRGSDGYDGQFYLLAALAPFHANSVVHFFWRQRLLYPLLGWTLGRGHAGATVAALALVNLAAVGLSTALLASWFARRGWHPAWALVGGVSAGSVLACQYLCPDALLVALLALALWAHDRRRWGLVALAMGGAILTKESALIVWLALAVGVAVTRPAPIAFGVLMAPLPWLAWVLSLAGGEPSTLVSFLSRSLGPPLDGWFGALTLETRVTLGLARAVAPLLCALMIPAVLWLAFQARGGPQQTIAAAALLWCVAALLWCEAIWQPLVALARNLAPLTLLGGLLAAPPGRRGRWVFAGVALALLALVIARALVLGQVPETFFTPER